MPVKFHDSGYVRRSDQISPLQTPSNSRRYHFIYTNRNSEEIKQNLLGPVSLHLLHLFNPSRLPIICLFDRIYNLNMILFHHILLPYAGGLCKLIYIYYSQYYIIYLWFQSLLIEALSSQRPTVRIRVKYTSP